MLRGAIAWQGSADSSLSWFTISSVSLEVFYSASPGYSPGRFDSSTGITQRGLVDIGIYAVPVSDWLSTQRPALIIKNQTS